MPNYKSIAYTISQVVNAELVSYSYIRNSDSDTNYFSC